MIKVQGDRGREGQEPGGGKKDLPAGRSHLIEDDVKNISWSLCSQGNMLFRCNLFANRNTSASFPTFTSIENGDVSRLIEDNTKDKR